MRTERAGHFFRADELPGVAIHTDADEWAVRTQRGVVLQCAHRRPPPHQRPWARHACVRLAQSWSAMGDPVRHIEARGAAWRGSEYQAGAEEARRLIAARARAVTA